MAFNTAFGRFIGLGPERKSAVVRTWFEQRLGGIHGFPTDEISVALLQNMIGACLHPKQGKEIGFVVCQAHRSYLP